MAVRVGLRFRKSQVRQLRAIAQRIRNDELGEQHVAVFEQAAEAAAIGEPLIVWCDDPIEAVAMADGYTRFGITRPAVEQLTQTGGPPPI